MMKRNILAAGLLLIGGMAMAQVKTEVKKFNLVGPYAVSMPHATDTVNVKGEKFDENTLLDAVSLTSPVSSIFDGILLPSQSDKKSVGVLSFYLNNTEYLKAQIEVKGPKNYKVFVDGKEHVGELALAPEHHTIAIKYLAEAGCGDTLSVVMDAKKSLMVTTDPKHPYMVHDLTDGLRVRGISLSPDGSLAQVNFQNTQRDGSSQWSYELRDTKTGRVVSQLGKNYGWMPRTVALVEETWEDGQRMLTRIDPLTWQRTRLATHLPKGGYTISPTEDFIIVSVQEEGPTEDADVFEVVEMDDRQPGWRNRNYLCRYDVATGLCQRLTFGNKGEMLCDISQDGRKLLIATSHSRLTKRPTTVTDYLLMDLQTMKTDTLFIDAEFVGGAYFSPDGRQVLFTGTPEAFQRVGCQLPPDVTPSMIETELFLYDIATRKITPLTKDFDPSVSNVEWSAADGMIYFSAEDRDYVNLFRLNPQTGKIDKLPVRGDYTYRFDLAAHAPVLGYLSYKTLEPASAYVLPLQKKGKEVCFFDGKTVIGDALLGTCQDWNYTNSKGDTVYGRLYLPHDFDATKKYPMIVYYYGGCSPTSRYFESPYAPQYWNSLGYVAYIVEPSGATGFGQEWASRHVNTAGQGPAEDIIEGVKKLCDTHPYINKKKIGCMGASYGGFMTQYLQTKTDIFAAAVSHAGIANHTSYWGEGYWGYNYSEVSMANSYPWSHRQLYVDQSPLFNADKIHTPLLLLHGTDDTNVPIVESLQMFTALKLLGRDVALVEVKGENHHILDYKKKEKWLATQMAWFQKWLKDDPTWWDVLYPKKNL